MRGTKILAFACSMIVAWNQISISVVPVYAIEENEINTVTVKEDFVDSLIVKDKEYDGTATADIDFSNVALNGVDTGDDVALTAKATFNDANSGDAKAVEVSDFELIGDDKDKYKLNLEPNFQIVTKTAKIAPAIIHLTPVGTFVKGEKLPKEIEYNINQNDIKANDNVNVTAKVSVSVDENNDYIYQIDDATATGNANYILAMQEDSKPTPSSPTAATLSSASIDKAGASYLEQHDFGIVANGAVRITLNAELSHDMPVIFILSDGQEVTDDSPRFYSHENIYRASGEFIVELAESETFKDVSLSVTIENGDQSSTVDLPLKLNGNNSTSHLIIDNKLPSVSSLTLKNHGLEGEHYFDARGIFVDSESGIRSIRYRWDNDVKSANWINYDNFSHNPGDKVDFYVKTDWNNSTDPRSVRPDGSHKLELEITDNAGNVYRDSGNLITDGADTKAPQPTYIRLDKTTETTWDKIINILPFGTFVNQKLVLSLKVEDRTETEQSSGVKSVALTDGKGENEKVIAADIKSSDGIYTYSMEPDQIISSWYLKLTDYNGNTEYFLIRDLLNSDIAKEPVEEATASEDNEAETTTTTAGMDWSRLKTDKSGMWIFDKTAPVVTPDYESGNGIQGDDGIYYYDKGTFILKCHDDSALHFITIEKSFRVSENEDWSKLEPETREFKEIKEDDVFEFNTDKAANGWYQFKVSIVDGAQNENDPRFGTFIIYVDHAKPEGTISVISPSNPNFKIRKDDNTYWVRERDADDKYLPITFRVDATPKGSKLRAITVEVIGGNGNSRIFEFNKNDIIEEDGMFYVTALVSTDSSSKEYLQLSENNTYEVKAIAEAFSHNKSDEIHFTVHVDTENPVVESFSVERKNTAAETILNFLTFGAFANDSLKLTVKVKDGQNDIGLDHVDISYTNSNGKSVNNMALTEESAGVYTCELALDTKVFQSDIIVTAYDRLDKSSKNAPNIQNTTGDKRTKDGNTFVMLEAEAPTLKVILPSSDSSKRDDGQIWYRQHFDTTEDDALKYIEVVVKDDASGIQRINMMINGQPIDHNVNEASQNAIITDIERNNTKILDFDSTRAMGELDRASLCDEFHYFYSTESIAEKIPANADGSYVITFEITDNAGNVTTAPVDENGNIYSDEKVVYYRDIVAPNVTQFIFDPASFDNISEVNQEDFIQKLEYGYYFKTAFDVMLTSVDPEPPSGLDYAVFRMVPYENGELKPEIISDPVPFSNGIAKYSVPKGFKGQIYGKAYDKVSNVSEERTPQGFVIDETAPTITVQELPENPAGKDANGNNIYTNSISIKVTISDTQSGLRSLSYSKDSELDKFDAVITDIPNDAGTGDNKVLGNGWKITGTDVNLVTEVSKVFTFDKDDNDIKMTFKATDRSGNECDPKSSGTFTIDTIAPQIAISNPSNLLNGLYYNGSTEYFITVTERNFSQELIIANIKNEFRSAVPTISFTSNGNSTHTAKVSFPEGDYSFSLSGTDLGGHKALISYNGAEANEYFFTSFNVDATKPKIQTNFKSFGSDENEAVYYNKQQTAEIIVTEHNFADSDMGISVKRKDPGTSHVVGGDGWSEIGYTSNWKADGDKHTLTIKFEKDGVYRITMAPKDRAGNAGEFAEGSSDHSTVFEIDTVIPTYEKRDGTSSSEKNFVATPFCDVYDEKRKNDPPPTVLFDDVNFDRIEVDTIVYTPTYENGKELGEIIKSPVSEELSKPITDKQFTLSNFDKDGVYALTFVAVDKAGNKSDPISNTYFRMVDTDVLAYIYNSKIGDKNSDDDNKKPTGYYSLMNTDGKAISKKATDFDNLDILVIKPKSDKQAGTLVLREDEKQYSPYDYNAFSIEEESVSETATMLKMHLPGEYFSETFRDDGLDTRMYLSVSIRDDVYLDLASIHIDNEAPTATIPDDFKNWHNYFFESEQTITLTDISELLDDTKTKVYECPRNGERKEIPHTYDPESNTLSFTLTKGVHHIDITLVDEAGNEYNIDRVKYVRVGNFRLYLGGGIVLVLGAVAAFFIIRRKRRG